MELWLFERRSCYQLSLSLSLSLSHEPNSREERRGEQVRGYLFGSRSSIAQLTEGLRGLKIYNKTNKHTNNNNNNNGIRIRGIYILANQTLSLSLSLLALFFNNPISWRKLASGWKTNWALEGWSLISCYRLQHQHSHSIRLG